MIIAKDGSLALHLRSRVKHGGRSCAEPQIMNFRAFRVFRGEELKRQSLALDP
jgi:hypothetical protein